MNRSCLRPAAVAGVALLAGVLLVAPGLALAYDGHDAHGQPCWATSGTVNGAYHARELDCIKDGTGSSSASPQPVQPVQPVQAQPVQPVQAQPVQPVQAQPVQPVQSQPVPSTSTRCVAVDPGAFVHVYKTNVAGAAYSLDDLANDQQLLITDPGAISGGLAIYADGTYQWLTQHAGLVTGTWVVDPTRPCGAITLQQGDNDEDWTVQSTDQTDGSIFVSDSYGVTFIGSLLA